MGRLTHILLKRLSAVFLLCLSIFLPQHALTAELVKMELTPRNILRHIKNDGARLTISRLRNETTGPKTNYEWVILKVESGELIWLEIANALLPGLEPLYQQAMFVSGAKAMRMHPENAIRLLKSKQWPLEYLCDAPFHEISQEGWEAHLLNVQSRLRHFTHPAFQREKKLCLRYIDWALKRYPQPMPRELKMNWHITQELP